MWDNGVVLWSVSDNHTVYQRAIVYPLSIVEPVKLYKHFSLDYNASQDHKENLWYL